MKFTRLNFLKFSEFFIHTTLNFQTNFYHSNFIISKNFQLTFYFNIPKFDLKKKLNISSTVFRLQSPTNLAQH